jgi:hypothetical protein
MTVVETDPELRGQVETLLSALVAADIEQVQRFIRSNAYDAGKVGHPSRIRESWLCSGAGSGTRAETKPLSMLRIPLGASGILSSK